MRIPRRPHRPPRPRARPLSLVGACVAAAVACAAAAGCGSSATPAVPQGLSGTVAGVPGNSQYAAENAAAATVLNPAAGSFLAGKTTVTTLGPTTPVNGDINPYAIWPVTQTAGTVSAGDVLVDNFNNASNHQGTGTTIVDLHPDGHLTVFAALPRQVSGCPGGVGLTTAMVQLKTGWVIVGSLPSANGQVSTAAAGCLLVLSPAGKLAGTISGSYLDGPWDETVSDNGRTATLFVTNTLVGVAPTTTAQVNRGTVVRITLSQSRTAAPKVTGETTIAGGFGEHPDAAAFVRGPTGLVLAPSGTLYVADNLGNRITSIPDAMTRTTSAGTGQALSQGGQLANPLGLVLAPDGDLLAANATNGKIVEITPAGRQVGEYYADDSIGQEPPGNGDLFDLAINQAGTGVLFVNDGTNVLELLH
jgi:hypothetical protein